MTSEYSFNLAIGQHTLEVKCDNVALYRQFIQFYNGFIIDRCPDFTVEIEVRTGNEFRIGEVNFDDGSITLTAKGYDGRLDLAKFSGKLSLSNADPFIGADYFLRVAAATLAFQRGGLMVHAAGIAREQIAYLFVGKSGIGKTTVARNSPMGSVLNDDLLFLQPRENGWMVFSAPFYNQTQVKPIPNQAVLKGIYFLVQDKRVYLEEINQTSAVAELLANVPVLSGNPQMLNEIFSRCNQIIQAVHPYRLHFLPDDSFWKVIP
ncbi:MAG: hypothetical protein ACPL1K_02325 [Candidatus Kryptoniota bacterium]